MSNSKISALTGATTPLAGTEVLPIVQSSTTKQVSVANLTAGRAISATSVTASTGNFIVGTSGQGIDFSATPGTGTSELLADYEEGTWTPTIAGSTIAGSATYTVRTGTYTKIGDLIHAQLFLIWTGHTGTGNMLLTGLPFTSSATYANFSSISLSNWTVPITIGNVPMGYVLTNSTYAELVQMVAGGASIIFVPMAANAGFIAFTSYKI
jgi:hypothetical protein